MKRILSTCGFVLLLVIGAHAQTIRPTYINVTRYTSLTTAQEATVTPPLQNGDFWFNSEISCYRMRMSGVNNCVVFVLGTPSAGSQVPISASATSVDWRPITPCSNGNVDKVLYDATTRTFTCGVDQNTQPGTGITSLNGETGGTQTFATGTTGTDFNIASALNVHTFHLPAASATVSGKVTTGAQTFAGIKTFGSVVVGANGVNGEAFRVGDDAALHDVNLVNHAQIRGIQDPLQGFIGFGSSSGFRIGYNGSNPIAVGSKVIDLDADMVDGQHGPFEPAGTFSGVGACGANTFASTLNDGSAPTCTQPSFANLSGTATDTQVPNTITLDNLTQVTTRNLSDMQGTISTAQIPTQLDLSGKVLQGPFPLVFEGTTVDVNQISVSIGDPSGDRTFYIDGQVNTVAVQHDSGAVADRFLTSIGATGIISTAQVSFSNLSGAATDAQIPNTITLDNLTQVTTRNFSAMQGTVTDVQLANNYSGVGACGVNLWASTLNDNAAPTCTQIGFSNLSGVASDAQIPASIARDTEVEARKFIWRGGFYEATPIVVLHPAALSVPSECASNITVNKVVITALNKGSANFSFNVTRFNSAGTSQNSVFSGAQQYSSTGNNRQDFTASTTTATATDYFRVDIATISGQGDVTFLVEGKCSVLP